MAKIYLDYSATTPVDQRVIKQMLPYYSEKFGNASSLHSFGQDAAAAVLAARSELADFLNCRPQEIVFTSGATEANNLAIRGLAAALAGINKKIHIITSSVEHDAVLEPLKELARNGVEVTYLPVDKRGVVNLDDFKRRVKDNTVLVSLMYVNSEVGAIQPVRAIGKLIKKINSRKLKAWQNSSIKQRGNKPAPIYFHSDVTQAINYLNCDVNYLHLDLLSLSGHKIYGPKGVGALYFRSGTPLQAQQLGGHQENNLRSGTLNVPAIVGLGAAVKLAGQEQEKNYNKIKRLRDQLAAGIKKRVPRAVLNTDLKNSSPALVHFSFLGAEGESILIALDLEDIAVSTGSACASASLRASHVLLAMGIKEEVAHSSVRFSLGKFTTAADIKKVVKVLPPIIARLRRMSPQ